MRVAFHLPANGRSIFTTAGSSSGTVVRPDRISGQLRRRPPTTRGRPGGLVQNGFAAGRVAPRFCSTPVRSAQIGTSRAWTSGAAQLLAACRTMTRCCMLHARPEDDQLFGTAINVDEDPLPKHVVLEVRPHSRDVRRRKLGIYMECELRPRSGCKVPWVSSRSGAGADDPPPRGGRIPSRFPRAHGIPGVEGRGDPSSRRPRTPFQRKRGAPWSVGGPRDWACREGTECAQRSNDPLLRSVNRTADSPSGYARGTCERAVWRPWPTALRGP